MSRIDSLRSEDYEIPEAGLGGILSPALLVWLDQVRDNLETVKGHLDGDLDRWRVHVKTSKIPRVWRELVRFGLRKFKCATTREAEKLLSVLDGEGIQDADLLVAYPHQGPALARLAMLHERHPRTRLSVLAEAPGVVREIHGDLGIYVDVNPGMNRTGVEPRDVERIVAVAKAAGERFGGIHFYEGQVRSGNSDERQREAVALYEQLMVLMLQLDRAEIRVKELVTSGTPSFLHALEFQPFRNLGWARHRVSPGTVVFWDFGYDDMVQELALAPAALVMSRVVSHPSPGRVTLDAGSKSLAAEAGDPCARVLGRPGLVAEKPSEEHLPFEVVSGPVPELGEPLLLIPRHVCPTVNLAEEAVLIEDGKILEIAPVSARAHDVSVDSPLP
ncbi:MAG: alanine racemase [Planctomycetota bacterium]